MGGKQRGWRREEDSKECLTARTTAGALGPGGWDPGRATTSGALPLAGAVPAGQPSALPHLGRPAFEPKDRPNPRGLT